MTDSICHVSLQEGLLNSDDTKTSLMRILQLLDWNGLDQIDLVFILPVHRVM